MKKLISLLTLLAITVGCTTASIREEVEREKAEFAKVYDRAEMIDRSYEMVAKKDDLPQETRDAFAELTAQTYQRVQELNKNINMSKLVLFRNLLSEDSDQRKIEYLTNELREYNDKKIDIMIEAFFKAEMILGKEFLEPMMHDRFHHFWFEEFADRQEDR